MKSSEINFLIKKIIKETIEEDKVFIGPNLMKDYESMGCKTGKENNKFFYLKSSCEVKLNESKTYKKLLIEASVSDCPGDADCEQIAPNLVSAKQSQGCQAGKGKDNKYYYLKSTCGGRGGGGGITIPPINIPPITVPTIPTLPDWKEIGRDIYNAAKTAGKKVMEYGGKFYEYVKDALTPDPNNPNNNTPAPVVKDNPGYPDCVDNWIGRVYNSNGEAIIVVQGETWILSKDGKYINSKGGKGTWKCDGYDANGAPQISFQGALPSENGNNPNNNIAENQFPPCVTGLKKYQDPTSGDYYYGTATDDAGNKFTAQYFATKKTSSDGTNGNTVFVRPPGNEKPWSGVYWCNGDNIVINSWDGNIKLKAQSMVSNEYSQANKTSIEQYNVGGLEIFIGDGNTLNRRDITSAVNVLTQYIKQYTRSNYYNWFFEMLGNIKSFLEKENLPAEVAYIDGQIAKYKAAIDAVQTNEVANKQGLDWDVLSDPLPEEQNTVYSKNNKDLKGTFPFTNAKEPVFVYQLKTQKSSRAARQQTDALLSDYMAGNSFDETYCVNELKLFVQYANQPQLIKGNAKTVSDTYINPDDVKPAKQVIKMCSRANLYNSKKYGEALNWFKTASDQKYKIDFGAECAQAQPPNPTEC